MKVLTEVVSLWKTSAHHPKELLKCFAERIGDQLAQLIEDMWERTSSEIEKNGKIEGDTEAAQTYECLAKALTFADSSCGEVVKHGQAISEAL